jgi:MFS family permease
VVSVILVMPQFLDRFPEVANGGGFYKGLMTAMIELGALIGALNQGWIADKLSRKYSIVLAAIIFIIGGVLQTAAVNYAMLTFARFFGGLGVGMLSMVAPLYISEISPPEIRGTLLVLEELSIVTGIVIAFWTTYGTLNISSEWSWRLPLSSSVWESSSSLSRLDGSARKIATTTHSSLSRLCASFPLPIVESSASGSTSARKLLCTQRSALRSTLSCKSVRSVTESSLKSLDGLICSRKDAGAGLSLVRDSCSSNRLALQSLSRQAYH